MTTRPKGAYPLNIRWDLPLVMGPVSEHYREWGRHLADIGILSLTLCDPLFPSAGCAAILDSLRDTGMGVTLTVAGSVASRHIAEHLESLNIQRLLFHVESFDEFRTVIGELKRLRRMGVAVGIAFTVTRSNYWDMPDVLLFGKISGVNTITVRMPSSPGASFFVDRLGRQELAQRLRHIDLAYMDLTIHDPFLRKLCRMVSPASGSGCRAAGSRVYISPEATVFPCPSMPFTLGSLMEMTIGDILSSEKRHEVLLGIAHLPEACCSCPSVKLCNGGCRGRAFAFYESFREVDPACERPKQFPL